MGRIAWLKWRMSYGNPNTRLTEMKFFLNFELYNLICILSGYRIVHWLNRKAPGPAGKYLRVVRSAPVLVRLLDRWVSFGEESHCEYLPYAAGVEADLRRAGRCVSIVEISYRLSGGVY
jgi:hypothetical protein